MTNRSQSDWKVLKIGESDGLDADILSKELRGFFCTLRCAKDLDGFLPLRPCDKTNYDILHFSGYADGDLLGRPRVRMRSPPYELVDLSLTEIKRVLRQTSVLPNLVILDTASMADDVQEYTAFLEEFAIRAMLFYTNTKPSINGRRHFLPRFLRCILAGHSFEEAKKAAMIADPGEPEIDLQPQIEYNEKLLGLHKNRLTKVSLKYPG